MKNFINIIEDYDPKAALKAADKVVAKIEAAAEETAKVVVQAAEETTANIDVALTLGTDPDLAGFEVVHDLRSTNLDFEDAVKVKHLRAKLKDDAVDLDKEGITRLKDGTNEEFVVIPSEPKLEDNKIVSTVTNFIKDNIESYAFAVIAGEVGKQLLVEGYTNPIIEDIAAGQVARTSKVTKLILGEKAVKAAAEAYAEGFRPVVMDKVGQNISAVCSAIPAAAQSVYKITVNRDFEAAKNAGIEITKAVIVAGGTPYAIDAVATLGACGTAAIVSTIPVVGPAVAPYTTYASKTAISAAIHNSGMAPAFAKTCLDVACKGAGIASKYAFSFASMVRDAAKSAYNKCTAPAA